jgi:hypothetical protein
MNLNKCPILHLAGSGSGTRSSFKKAATHVLALASFVRGDFATDPTTCARFLRTNQTLVGHACTSSLSHLLIVNKLLSLSHTHTRTRTHTSEVIHRVDQKLHEMLGRLEGVFREKSVTTHKEHEFMTLSNLPLVNFWTLERSESLAHVSQRAVSQ